MLWGLSQVAFVSEMLRDQATAAVQGLCQSLKMSLRRAGDGRPLRLVAVWKAGREAAAVCGSASRTQRPHGIASYR